MNTWLQKTKIHLKDKSFLTSLLAAFLLLIISLVINFYAGAYATEKASNSVTDIVLSNIRVYDVDAMFIYGPVVFWIFIAILLLFEPKRIPFALKSIALFTIIRAIFISLTHIGPFPTQLIIDASKIMDKFAFGGDLFFSGHTGLPFLMALVFWHNIYLRWIFIFTSLTFGAVVLMGHLHYSIDVLSAFFITYTIFHISLFLFKKDRALFLR
jgi:uncharacterized membrane protein